MSRRKVDIVNAVMPVAEPVRGANLNEVRVEIRMIYGPTATKTEVREVLRRAAGQGLMRLDFHFGTE